MDNSSQTFPNFPLFEKLVKFARQLSQSHIAIGDVCAGIEASHLQLLNDVLSVKQAAWNSLGTNVRHKLDRGDEVFLLLLAKPGYQYTVGFLAILALGAIIVPVSSHVTAKECQYFVDKSTASGLLFDSSNVRYKDVIQSHRREMRQFGPFLELDIGFRQGNSSLAPHEIHLHPSRRLNRSQAGLVIFTSGTTGPPKAVVLPREILCSGSQSLADHFEINANDVALHCMPVHHIAGISVCLVPFLLNGARLEFEPFDVQRVWDRWRGGKVTVFGGVPTMYARLMRHYEDVLSQKPDAKDYVDGLRQTRFLMSGTSALVSSLRNRWQVLSGGKRILERYGASEYSTAILTPLHDNHWVPDGSVGEVLSGCNVRLAAEPQGEILVKVPGMMLRYHRDPESTRKAFDDQGFFKTGDIGRREGPYWFILGRESVDIIKSGGYKISSLDVEREILSLDFISEAAVIGVADEEFGQRVAAVVVLRNIKHLSLTQLRNSLRQSLSGYKLPTLLYVAKNLPKTTSGKVQKPVLRKQIFETTKHLADIQKFVPRSSTQEQAKL